MKHKLSAVITGRNDDYSGDLHLRMIPSINSFLEEYDEVVYVDFNSKNGSYINNIKQHIKPTKKLKAITVSPTDVENISKNYSEKFIEVFARNIGIRRASGDYILSTNPDIICTRPDDNILQEDVMYTAARRDVPIELYTRYSSGDLKNILLNNINLFQKKPRVIDENGNPIWDPNDRWSVVVCCGDYQLAHKDVWNKIKGFEESATGRCYADSNLMKKAALCSYELKELELSVFHLNHNTPKYIKNDNETPKNCQVTYVQNFNSSTNKDTWGFSDLTFQEEII